MLSVDTEKAEGLFAAFCSKGQMSDFQAFPGPLGHQEAEKGSNAADLHGETRPGIPNQTDTLGCLFRKAAIIMSATSSAF